MNAKCQNTEGSFYCHCITGYRLLSGDEKFSNSSENTCQKITPSNKTKDTKELQRVVERIESLLNNKTLWGMEERRNIASTATSFLQTVESTVLDTALKAPDQKIQKVQNSTLAVETRVVTDCSQGIMFNLKAQMNSMDIHCDDIIQGDIQGPSAVAFVSFSSLGNIINATFFEEMNDKDRVYLNSQIVSAAIGPKRNTSLSQSVILNFQHVKMNPGIKKIFCVYWKGTKEGGHWSTEGCVLMQANETHTTCSSTHLSSFAVLMAFHSQKHDPALNVITYVGLSLSLLCLLLAALTFLLCKPIQNTSTSLHLQLSICLFLAHLLFLTGIDQTEPEVLCSVIAGMLHYLYLAAFTWMLLEGLHLFLTVRNLKVANYTSAGRFKKRFMYPFGYGIPAVIVAISAIAGHRNYGTYTHCWLKIDKGFIWSFMGPVALIVLINLVFYFQILWILRTKLSSLNKEVSTIKNTRIMTLKSIAQLFILGCSWGLGFFMVEEVGKTVGSIIAYTFTIINILQGVLLFVVYCLLNLQVQMEFKKWFHGLWKGIETESTEVSRSTNHTKMEKLETSSEIFCRRDPASSVQPPPGVQLVTVSWVRAES